MADKVATGCKGLDEVLFGGLPLNTISVIMGAPGTGKTILAEQIAFNNATVERPALYLTTLSEPLEKYIAHGHEYDFFDADKVGRSVIYEDLGLMVRQRGVDKLAEIVTEQLVNYSPAFLFIDSFKALNELLDPTVERRSVIFDVASVLSAYQCNSFLVGEYSQEMMTELPEFAIADVVIQMIKYSTNVREQRFLKIEKVRGSNSIPGMHAFSISSEGIDLYPRLLTPKMAATYEPRIERVNTGISGLDDLIETGFWRGSTTMIAGPSGSGKTILGLHFVREGAKKGEQSLYVGFQENPTQLARVMKNFGWKTEELLTNGKIEMVYRSPVEMQLDSITAEIFQRVREGKVQRVVIDALGDLERCSIDRQRFSDFIYALTQWFAAQNVTCMMLYELNELFEFHHISNAEISNLSDNVILLRFRPDPELKRTLRIIKTRGSAHDNGEHTVQITNQGIVISQTRE
jgi:circadian clock protein KaiC